MESTGEKNIAAGEGEKKVSKERGLRNSGPLLEGEVRAVGTLGNIEMTVRG